MGGCAVFVLVIGVDNLVYVYTVDQGGRKVSRLGKCSVSGQWSPARATTPPSGVQN